MENKLKFSPYIKEAVAVGHGRTHVVAMVNIDLQSVGHWAEEQGIPYTTYQDLSQKGPVLRPDRRRDRPGQRRRCPRPPASARSSSCTRSWTPTTRS